MYFVTVWEFCPWIHSHCRQLVLNSDLLLISDFIVSLFTFIFNVTHIQDQCGRICFPEMNYIHKWIIMTTPVTHISLCSCANKQQENGSHWTMASVWILKVECRLAARRGKKRAKVLTLFFCAASKAVTSVQGWYVPSSFLCKVSLGQISVKSAIQNTLNWIELKVLLKWKPLQILILSKSSLSHPLPCVVFQLSSQANKE